MKMKGIAIATASLLATGAYAAQTAKLSGATSAQQRAKVSMLKKKNLKTVPSTRTTVAKTASSADTVYSTSSSATSTATQSMPGLTTGSSVAKGAAVGAKKKSFVDGIRASIGLEYYGSSLAEPLSGWQTDRVGGYAQGLFPSELDTRATLGYQLTSNLQLSYNAYFYSMPDTFDGEDQGGNFTFKPQASYLRLNVGKFAQLGKVKWNGDFRIYPGLGEDGKRVPIYFRTGQNFVAPISSRMNLAAYNTLRYYHRVSSAYAPKNDANGNAIDFRFTVTPTVEYQISDKVGTYLGYNMDFAHSHNQGIFDRTEKFKGSRYGTLYYHYAELGASIDLAKSLNVTPYIDSYVNKMSFESLQYGVNLALNLL